LKIQNSKSFYPLLVCLAVVLLWFSPWWIGGRNLAPLDLLNEMMQPWRGASDTGSAKNHIVSDAVDQYLVYRMVAAESYAKEGWLGWSRLTYGGTAQYANTMALYYDWTMQLHRWFDFWTAWHLGLMAQVFLAAAGMLFFLRSRGIGPLWAGCGALAYAANSQFVTWIYHRWALSSFCWVPWILWAIDRYRGGKKGIGWMVPLFVAMAFLGGTLQHAALVVLAVAAMWAEEAIHLMADRGEPKHSSFVRQLRLLGRYSAWGIVGMGLAAMMFLPCADAFLTSNRLGLHTGMTVNTAQSIYPQGPLQPLFNLAAYPLQFFPSIVGRCESLDLLKAFKSELFYVAYFGSLPVLIAFCALFRKPTPWAARLLIGAGLILPLTPLVRFLYQRLYLLWIVGGILAFAHFMESASRESRLKVFKIVGGCVALGALCWTSLSALLYLKPAPLEILREKLVAQAQGSSFGFFDAWISRRVNHFVGDLFIWSPQQLLPLIFLATALLGFRLSASFSGEKRRAGQWILAISVVIEVSLFASRWIVFTDPKDSPLYPVTPEVRVLQQQVGPQGRVTTLIHPSAHMARTPFVPNTLSAYGIAIIGGYDSIIPHGMTLPNESAGDARKLGRMGVSHLVTWPGNPEVPADWKWVWSSTSMELYENPYRVPIYSAFRSEKDLDGLVDGSIAKPYPLTELGGLENTRSFRVPAGMTRVRVAENQASGWEYRRRDLHLDWQPVACGRDQSMILTLPPSSHETLVEMRYAPPLRRYGFQISMISLLVWITYGLLLRFKSRKESQQTLISPA
jgi:hypothetical protein